MKTNLVNIKPLRNALFSKKVGEYGHDSTRTALPELQASIHPSRSDESRVQLIEVVCCYHHHSALGEFRLMKSIGILCALLITPSIEKVLYAYLGLHNSVKHLKQIRQCQFSLFV